MNRILNNINHAFLSFVFYKDKIYLNFNRRNIFKISRSYNKYFEVLANCFKDNTFVISILNNINW